LGDQLDVLLHLCKIYLWFISFDALSRSNKSHLGHLRISKLAEIGIDPEMSPEMLDDYMADFTVPWDQWEVRFSCFHSCALGKVKFGLFKVYSFRLLRLMQDNMQIMIYF